MKTLELLQENPVSAELIKNHYKGILMNSLSVTPDLPDNFKEFLEERGISDEDIAVLIDSNPRVLVDVFDKNNLFTCLDMQFTEGKPVFGVNIDGAISEQKFQNRRDAENFMITESIKILNNRTN